MITVDNFSNCLHWKINGTNKVCVASSSIAFKKQTPAWPSHCLCDILWQIVIPCPQTRSWTTQLEHAQKLKLSQTHNFGQFCFGKDCGNNSIHIASKMNRFVQKTFDHSHLVTWLQFGLHDTQKVFTNWIVFLTQSMLGPFCVNSSSGIWLTKSGMWWGTVFCGFEKQNTLHQLMLAFVHLEILHGDLMTFGNIVWIDLWVQQFCFFVGTMWSTFACDFNWHFGMTAKGNVCKQRAFVSTSAKKSVKHWNSGRAHVKDCCCDQMEMN